MKGIYFSPTVGKSTGDRARLFRSGFVAQSLVFQRLCGFSFKFVTRLAQLRGELGLRIGGHVLIPQGGSVSLSLSPSHRVNPTQPACSAGPAVRPCGSSNCGKAARLESEPCATFFQRRGLLPRRRRANPNFEVGTSFMMRTAAIFGCVVPIATKSSCAGIRRRVDAPFLSDQPAGKSIDSRPQAAILGVAE